ncbi:MAG: hypoxanthine-guanine phosphoribosyltransferase [Gammaproteobacteria bacterium]|nr:hypoxanthine-guanine phosphoribosyltransferase [Gammaproteobacteria bacterium]
MHEREHAWAVYAQAERLYSAEEVEHALDRMAEEVTGALADRDPVLLCVMTGGVVPAGKLLPRLDFPLQLDYIHATRYRGEVRGGVLHWMARPALPLRERVVLLIDDILDEGHTIVGIEQYCLAEGARAVYTAILIDKRHQRKVPGARADFLGLEVDDRYVFGYGMDYRGYLRNAPGIFAVTGG